MTEQEFRGRCESALGRWYVWGANGPDTRDRSGFVQWTRRMIDLDPPEDQSSDGLLRFFGKSPRGARVARREDARTGDIMFFGNDEAATHIALAWSDGKMIEAGGVGRSTRSVEDARAVDAKVRVAPIARRKDRIAIIRPAGLPW